LAAYSSSFKPASGREKYLCEEEVVFALSPEEMWDLEEMIKVLEGL